jgi:hypothetical protein
LTPDEMLLRATCASPASHSRITGVKRGR